MDGRHKALFEVQPSLALTGEGTAYLATYRVANAHNPLAMITLPRSVVETAVFSNTSISLELRSDGSLVAYASDHSMETLASLSLAELVADALRSELVTLEDGPGVWINLEVELKRALASVREFRLRRGNI